jgi:murein DD-endopeptidase MepM/ murein hydrolase activator NlpD
MKRCSGMVILVLALVLWGASPAAARPSRWGWPLDGPFAVVRGFSAPPLPWLPGHRGVDLSGRPGQVVRAAGAGTVSFAGPLAGRGVVSIQHPDGLRTTYEPVTAQVSAGQAVTLGQSIGILQAGHPLCAMPACLHWGLRRGEQYLNPLWLVLTPVLRLKPLANPTSRGSAWPRRRRAGRSRPAGCRPGPTPAAPVHPARR